MRNRYRRMSAGDLSYALDMLDLSAGKFARLCGHQRKRVLAWLHGTEQIPHHIYMLSETWLEFSDTLAFARDLADEMIVEEEEQIDECPT